MRYFLKNIAQDSMLRTIILIVLGVAMWVPTFLREEKNALVIVTLVLTIINTLLTTHYFYRGGISSLPSPFVAATIWFASSAFPTLHSCWQAQLVIMGVLLACLVVLRMDYQHEATEEAFAALVADNSTDTAADEGLGLECVDEDRLKRGDDMRVVYADNNK